MLAALYLRSSKDRSDVSLAAQRHELEKLATSRSLKIVKSYEDAVESGATEDRPAFAELILDIKNARRGWTALLVYDTSRIARRRYIAQAIKHEAKKRGVIILYARMPADLDPVAEIVLESVFEAMDEAHSLMSREKGLAGMAQNVRQGWRAGGRAPFGYQLETHATGAIRDGKPVTKSKLVPNLDGSKVRQYLSARAQGEPRVGWAQLFGMNPSSLVGLEWNALTYAGHTVWNRHAPNGKGTKHRPRAEWQITRHTHEPLITDAQAESILAQLETSTIGHAIRLAKTYASNHLLTGVMYTSDGQAWKGHGRYYRLRKCSAERGKLVSASMVDDAVLEQMRTDLNSELFVRQVLQLARNWKATSNPIDALETRIRQLEREKQKAARLALTDDAGTFLPLVSEKTKQMEALQRELAAIRTDDSLSSYVAKLTPESIRSLLLEAEPDEMVQIFVDRVQLDLPALECRLHYKPIPGRQVRGDLSRPLGDAISSHTPDLIRVIPLRRAA